ncbi:hypothetical protein ACIRL2_29205 [Embleya sp. NPDC127516]|uniref:hypothetical protein n=1 Tax=Embleya sp. NPDC127516 TaxID=3363990 RepID=UPI00380FFA3B
MNHPTSPYATADPALRHVIPSPFGQTPRPGLLALTACGNLAVVPATAPVHLDSDHADPDDLCPRCAAAVQDADAHPDIRPHTLCEMCEAPTRHGNLCAPCRQDAHDACTTGRPALSTIDTIRVAAAALGLPAPAVRRDLLDPSTLHVHVHLTHLDQWARWRELFDAGHGTEVNRSRYTHVPGSHAGARVVLIGHGLPALRAAARTTPQPPFGTPRT